MYLLCNYEGIQMSMGKNNIYTENKLINMYIKFSEKLKKKNGASISDFHKYSENYGLPNYNYYMKIFKNMENLRNQAGYNSIIMREYRDEEIKEMIDKFYNKYKRYPSSDDCLKQKDFLSYYIILKKYGSLKNMYKTFKINNFNTNLISLKKEDDLVLQEVAEIIIKYDAHTWTKFRNLKISPAGKAYKRRLNMSWFEMYNKAINSNKTRFITKEDVIEKYESAKKRLNKDIVGVNDLKKFHISTKSFTRFWGSFANFIEEYENRDVRVKKFHYTEDELIKMYKDFSDYLGKEEGASDIDFEKYASDYGIPSHSHYRKKFTTMYNLKTKSGYKPITSNYSKFTRSQIIELLYKSYKKYKRKLKTKEIKASQELPSYITITRYLNETSVKKIWEIVLSEKGIDDKIKNGADNEI